MVLHFAYTERERGKAGRGERSNCGLVQLTGCRIRCGDAMCVELINTRIKTAMLMSGYTYNRCEETRCYLLLRIRNCVYYMQVQLVPRECLTNMCGDTQNSSTITVLVEIINAKHLSHIYCFVVIVSWKMSLLHSLCFLKWKFIQRAAAFSFKATLKMLLRSKSQKYEKKKKNTLKVFSYFQANGVFKSDGT